MAKLTPWTPEEAKKRLAERLKNAKEARRRFEKEWEDNERILYSIASPHNSLGGVTDDLSVEDGYLDDGGEVSLRSNYTINTTFKNYRFIQSQLSSNPPAVIPRPTSSDPNDHRKADAADRLNKYALRTYKLQEVFDQATSNCLRYGLGIIKTTWDPDKGEILEFDEQTQELTMEGDISFTYPSPWDLYFDPNAINLEKSLYVFERLMMTYEEACHRFPNKKDVLDKYKDKSENFSNQDDQGRKGFRQKRYNVVEIYQYWEKGVPENGFIGRFCYCTKEGDLLTDLKPNPHRFPPPYDRGLGITEDEYEARKEKIARASLPYHVMTDNDLPDTVYGRSFVTYQAPLQDLHNRLLNTVVDNIRAHGVARLILPDGTEIADDSITTSPMDIVRTTGQRDPHFMDPMQLPPAIDKMLDYIKLGGDDMAGVNESMFGQQSREMSGFSMQYATSQGNMIRRRLFNKYIALVEAVYTDYLNLVRKHWTSTRTIYVLGQEKAFEAFDIKGSDINGGFDLIVEYGTSFSLDPIERRKELISLLPLFEKAEVDYKSILRFLKLNEFEGLIDKTQLANDRQREIFDEIIRTQEVVHPRELQDHKRMLDYCYEFVMTAEFKYLPEETKALIDNYIKEVEQMAAQGAQPAPPPGQPGLPLAGPQPAESPAQMGIPLPSAS